MTEQTKKTRTARAAGFQANIAIFIPVDKGSLKSQAETSTALAAAEEAGDLAGVMNLPGVRILAIKNVRYAPLATDPAEAGKEVGEDTHTDLEDTIAEAGEGEGEGEEIQAEDDTAPIEGLSSGRRRRA